jgi:integrase
MGQVMSFKPRVLERVEEQRPKQEKKRRLKGQGSVYLRGNTYWVQYRSDGNVYNESANTDKKTEAIEELKKKVGEIAQGPRPSREFAKTTFEDLKELYFMNFERRRKKDRERAEGIMKLLETLPEWLQPVLTFAFQTGWRKEEILGLQWEHIDMKERQIILPSRMSKNGRARPIYADDVVYKGLEGLLFHDLRRSGIREMVRSGYSERVAMEISGHKTRIVFDRHNIVSLDDQKAAAQ